MSIPTYCCLVDSHTLLSHIDYFSKYVHIYICIYIHVKRKRERERERERERNTYLRIDRWMDTCRRDGGRVATRHTLVSPSMTRHRVALPRHGPLAARSARAHTRPRCRLSAQTRRARDSSAPSVRRFASEFVPLYQ